MNLFYHPGACSLASHIALIEAGLPYSLVTISRDKRTGDGRDYLKINPTGFVPALEFDDGSVLGESVAVLAWIAEQAGTRLIPDGLGRWKALEATSFMATEIHANFKPFWKGAPQADKDHARDLLTRHFGLIADKLGDGSFLIGGRISIADLYLFVMLMWAKLHGIAVPDRFTDYFARLSAIPSVAQALAEEGLPT